MILKNISETKTGLSALIEAVQQGEQVLIGKAGKIKIHDDFDAPLHLEIAKAHGISITHTSELARLPNHQDPSDPRGQSRPRSLGAIN